MSEQWYLQAAPPGPRMIIWKFGGIMFGRVLAWGPAAAAGWFVSCEIEPLATEVLRTHGVGGKVRCACVQLITSGGGCEETLVNVVKFLIAIARRYGMVPALGDGGG